MFVFHLNAGYSEVFWRLSLDCTVGTINAFPGSTASTTCLSVRNQGIYHMITFYYSVRLRHYVVWLSVRPFVCLSVQITFFFEWKDEAGRGVIKTN